MHKSLKIMGLLGGAVVAACLLIISPFVYTTYLRITGWGDRTFYQQCVDGVDESIEVLIEKGIYKSKSDYYQNQMIFCDERPAGFAVFVYGITDQKILGEIAQIFLQKFVGVPAMKNMYFNAHAFSKNDDEHAEFFVFALPIKNWREGKVLSIEMRRN